jgi:hypothetical protein
MDRKWQATVTTTDDNLCNSATGNAQTETGEPMGEEVD